jgi:hypothetical protein
MAESIALPRPLLCVGVTGHRSGNAAYAAHRAAIERRLSELFEAMDIGTASHSGLGPTRLHSLLAEGADMIAIEQALARGWDVVAPLPFGLDLNIAINCQPGGEEGALALLAADDARAADMRRLATRVKLFELAEQDETVKTRFLAALRDPGDGDAALAFSVIASERAAVAGRVMIEQSDLLVAVWDGITPGSVGGTRHSIETALHHGAPVIWIDAANPERMHILQGPESLEVPRVSHGLDDVGTLVRRLVAPPEGDPEAGAIRFHAESWHRKSSRRFHAYRRIEALFGGRERGSRFGSLVETYETPESIAGGSAAPLIAAAEALPGTDRDFVARIATQLLGRFAWADGLSTFLSDAYRGGMVTNFLLSALAIAVGAAYLPLVDAHWKWPFALGELALLLAIVAITATGRRQRWHGRWLETRRVAEYLRHAPILLLLGVARAPDRWPKGSASWPEYYARNTLRGIGLPSVAITQDYLRSTLALIVSHASVQRDYHDSKAQRLTRVHHRLDRVSELLFLLAIGSVAAYLLIVGASEAHWIPEAAAYRVAKLFTFFGVVLPALGGAFAGIRYFGDFERFAAISEVTAEKLRGVEARAERLLADGVHALRYERVAALAHALDEIVIDEIENWQSVFAAKNIAVPV